MEESVTAYLGNLILHTALSVKLIHGVFGGGIEELAKSGASPSLPAWGAAKTPTAWAAQKRMVVNCIFAVEGEFGGDE